MTRNMSVSKMPTTRPFLFFACLLWVVMQVVPSPLMVSNPRNLKRLQNLHSNGTTSLGKAPRGRVPSSVTALATSNIRFALDLHSVLSTLDPHSNIFFSPLSVATGAAALLEGARGDTALQLAQVLYRYRRARRIAKQESSNSTVAMSFQSTLEDPVTTAKRVNNNRRLLDNVFSKRSTRYSLTYASRLFLQNDYEVLNTFTSSIRDGFRMDTQSLDLTGDPSGSSSAINSWVSHATMGKIPELVSPQSLGADARLVLTNAVHFKADWALQFERKSTHTRAFRFGHQKVVNTPFMYIQGSFPFADLSDSLGFQMVELAYAGDAGLSMLVVLPVGPDDVNFFHHEAPSARLIDMSDEERLASVMSTLKKQPSFLTSVDRHLRNTSVTVLLPKFSLGWESDLKKAFGELGIRDLFQQGRADLSGISGDMLLYVSNIFHKAVIDVDEQGTKAAAATAFVIKGRSMTLEPVFRADHPFLFFIRHRPTSTILFMGQVNRLKDVGDDNDSKTHQ